MATWPVGVGVGIVVVDASLTDGSGVGVAGGVEPGTVAVGVGASPSGGLDCVDGRLGVADGVLLGWLPLVLVLVLGWWLLLPLP